MTRETLVVDETRMLVEFYDSEYLENIISLLSGGYPAVTYVYFRHANEPDSGDRVRLEDFVRNRFGFAPDFLEIPENSIDSALTHLRQLAERMPCDIDITGGSSVFVAAAGALQERMGRERVRLHEYDVALGRRSFQCSGPCRAPEEGQAISLSVDECLALRGIRRLERDTPVRFDLRGGLRREILRLWDAVRGELRAWNAFSTLPADYAETWEGLLVEKRARGNQSRAVTTLLKKLERAGILSDLKMRDRESETVISFRLNVSEEGYILYQKGGNLLELLTYLAVEDSGLFSDCCAGICLDWEVRDTHSFSDPFNELDVVMTRGHIPCFASCKNTAVENDYLYEIMTMTRHFGGRYAIPVLVSSAENSESLRIRAEEMGIVLIDAVGELSAGQFTEKLGRAFRSDAAR